MRGKPLLILDFQFVQRITPAHAGKTRWPDCPASHGADHPRACGENAASCVPFDGAHGSPPRMRGKQNPDEDSIRLERITPAHAGKTQCLSHLPKILSDHPRACGENRKFRTVYKNTTGSPPRMRGKHNALYTSTRSERITPAHAGKTPAKYLTAAQTADHPRACGENLCGNSGNSTANGSPPRMRGKHKLLHVAAACGRITPAHAGKTY